MEVTLSVPDGKTVYTLYLGGYKSVSTITLRDRAGNVQTFTVGDLTTNYLNKVTVTVEATVHTEIYLDYTLLSGENIALSGMTAAKG